MLPAKKPVAKTPAKLMRLRCRLRPLFEGYLTNDQISEKDCDVTFECQGGHVRGHKIILSIVSKFFCQVFADQKSYEPTTVYVPDVPVSIMRMVLRLCYKDNITLTMITMKELGNYLSMFGLAWDNFNFMEAEDDLKINSRGSGTMSQVAGRVATPARQNLASTLALKKPVQVIKSSDVFGPRGNKFANAGGIVTSQSTVLKNPNQTFVLDTKSMSNGTETGSPPEYKFKVQTFKAATQQQNQSLKQQQPRPILPKPTFTHQGTPAKLSPGPPALTRISDINNSGIELELDDSQDDNDEGADAPESEHLFHQWMANVGKVSASPPRVLAKPGLQKRKSSPITAPQAGTSKGGSDKASKRQCSVCSWVFDEDSKWKWHEERHVGINLFKCTICESIFSTARQVYQHEMMEHGIIGTCDGELNPAEAQKKAQIQQAEQANEANRVTIMKTVHGTHYRRAGGLTALSQQKKTPPKRPQGNYANLHLNFGSRNALIGIGEHEGEHLIETRKLKQLHWLYVCNKCENSSDSSAKAIIHYKACYPEKELKFEETVVKYRQGFYGKCKCPLCPRRYTSLGGFLIHCGHMHQEYRRVFSHINSEDKMMCVNCRDKFVGPELFHAHLNGALSCNRPPKEDAAAETSPNDLGRQRQYTRLIGTNPRSARLQNRLAAVTACFEDDPIEESSFGEVACPICGEAAVANITEHLLSSHSELDIEVERVEESTLRCKPCGITFSICDLLAHNNSCTGSKGLNHVTQKKIAQVTAAKAPPKPKPPTITYPPGIGASPVDKVEKSDLKSIDVIREAMTCGVCNRVGKKMNVIAECLRSHGVYRCAICFNSYLSKEQNSLHLRKCHSNNSGRVICPICNIVRSNAGQLTSHMFLAHWLPVLQENAVDIRANKLMNKLQESDSSMNESGTTDAMDTTTDTSGVDADESGATAADESTSTELDVSLATKSPDVGLPEYEGKDGEEVLPESEAMDAPADDDDDQPPTLLAEGTPTPVETEMTSDTTKA